MRRRCLGHEQPLSGQHACLKANDQRCRPRGHPLVYTPALVARSSLLAISNELLGLVRAIDVDEDIDSSTTPGEDIDGFITCEGGHVLT